jgi:hypothetical protein
MPYCPNCGVELAADARRCPLCGAAAVDDLASATRNGLAQTSIEKRGDRIFDPDNSEKLTPKERITIRWEVLSVSTLIAAIAVSCVNLLVSGDLTWALYPLFSLALLWLLYTALVKLSKPPALGGLVAGLAILLFILALDIVDGSPTWAPKIGMPIALIAEVAFALAWIVGSHAKTKGVNLIAFALLAATVTCLGIEGTLSLNFKGIIRIVWSGVVASALVPVAVFLFYLHHRVSKVSNLRRLFRL